MRSRKRDDVTMSSRVSNVLGKQQFKTTAGIMLHSGRMCKISKSRSDVIFDMSKGTRLTLRPTHIRLVPNLHFSPTTCQTLYYGIGTSSLAIAF